MCKALPSARRILFEGLRGIAEGREAWQRSRRPLSRGGRACALGCSFQLACIRRQEPKREQLQQQYSESCQL